MLDFLNAINPLLAFLAGGTIGILAGVLFAVTKLIAAGHHRCLRCFQDGRHARAECTLRAAHQQKEDRKWS